MSSLAQPKEACGRTHLDQEEKGNVSRMEALECNVAGPICFVLFAFPSKRHTLCDVANDGRFDFDGLDVN